MEIQFFNTQTQHTNIKYLRKQHARAKRIYAMIRKHRTWNDRVDKCLWVFYPSVEAAGIRIPPCGAKTERTDEYDLLVFYERRDYAWCVEWNDKRITTTNSRRGSVNTNGMEESSWLAEAARWKPKSQIVSRRLDMTSRQSVSVSVCVFVLVWCCWGWAGGCWLWIQRDMDWISNWVMGLCVSNGAGSLNITQTFSTHSIWIQDTTLSNAFIAIHEIQKRTIYIRIFDSHINTNKISLPYSGLFHTLFWIILFFFYNWKSTNNVSIKMCCISNS